MDAYRGLILALAETPVYSAADLRQKRRIIGKVWLTAEGEWYDRVRNGVASGAANLDHLRDSMLRSGGGPAIAKLLIRRRNGDVP